MPHDLFIVGSGRSGTSMVAGLFSSCGYFFGTDLVKPAPSNPLGFFEDFEVNRINEALIRPVLPERETVAGLQYRADVPQDRQLWLARAPLSATFVAGEAERTRIAAMVRSRPFCLKDPRFCYTLAAWREIAPTARMVCVFRRPQVVAASILRELGGAPYLASLAMSVEQILEMWRLMYGHVLERHSLTGEWLFVEYQQLFQPATLGRIAAFAGAQPDANFPSRQLDRSQPIELIDERAEAIYRELCDRTTHT